MVEAMEEKDRAYRRLESIGSAHEARTTEMHCIIVELNRKLKSRMENAIMEEHEPEGSGNSSFFILTIMHADHKCCSVGIKLSRGICV